MSSMSMHAELDFEASAVALETLAPESRGRRLWRALGPRPRTEAAEAVSNRRPDGHRRCVPPLLSPPVLVLRFSVHEPAGDGPRLACASPGPCGLRGPFFAVLYSPQPRAGCGRPLVASIPLTSPCSCRSQMRMLARRLPNMTGDKGFSPLSLSGLILRQACPRCAPSGPSPPASPSG